MFELTVGTETYSDMMNSIVILTLGWKDPLWANLVQKVVFKALCYLKWLAFSILMLPE